MWCHGLTASGVLRFQCPLCKCTASRRRPDTSARHTQTRLRHWLTHKETLSLLGARLKLSRQTLSKQFREVFGKPWHVTIKVPRVIRVLVLDATWIHKRELLVLTALLDKGIITWSFAPQETADSWYCFLEHLSPPLVVVIDGHTGLLKAVHKLWPFCPIQRCHFHTSLPTLSIRTCQILPTMLRAASTQRSKKQFVCIEDFANIKRKHSCRFS